MLHPLVGRRGFMVMHRARGIRLPHIEVEHHQRQQRRHESPGHEPQSRGSAGKGKFRSEHNMDALAPFRHHGV